MKALGIILDSRRKSSSHDLLNTRLISTLPVLGMYRIVDFPLSNMTNSGISQVAVIPRKNSRSLSDHLSSTKWWNFGRKKGSLFLLPPYNSSDSPGFFKGTADSLYQNISFLEKSNEEYVIIVNSHAIYNMDYNIVINDHIKSGADITVVCSDQHYDADYSKFGVLTVGHNKTVLKFEEKPLDPEGRHISLGIYVIKRSFLIKILKDLHDDERYDFVHDFIERHQKRIKINAFEYNGYWRSISDIHDFFRANMDFLEYETRRNILHTKPRIFSKVKDEPPTKYNYGVNTVNSIIANGCIINSYIESSVISRGVFQSENSSIKHSIIMEDVVVGKNCALEYVIADRGVIISDDKQLIGTRENPIVLSKNQII